jgi:ribosomal 50S subunit-associated protein YjgA (DUF615 family)
MKEVNAIWEATELPDDATTKILAKSSTDFLRENVIESIVSTLNKVSAIDSQIEIVLQKIFDQVETEENIKLSDLFRFFSILKEYRLEQFNSAISPFQAQGNTPSPLTDRGRDNTEDEEMNKLSKSLSSNDLQKLKNLSDNLDGLLELVSAVQHIDPQE